MKRILAVTLTAAVAAGTAWALDAAALGAQGPANPQPPAGQPAAAQQPPAGQGRGGGRGGPIVPPLAFEDRTGFESIFNG